MVLPRPTSSASSRLTRGASNGAGDRFELVVLDRDAGAERRLKGLHVGGGDGRPADGVEERGQPFRRVEAALGDVGQRAARQDAGGRARPPRSRPGCRRTRRPRRSASSSRCAAFACNLADHPLAAADVDERTVRRDCGCSAVLDVVVHSLVMVLVALTDGIAGRLRDSAIVHRVHSMVGCGPSHAWRGAAAALRWQAARDTDR